MEQGFASIVLWIGLLSPPTFSIPWPNKCEVCDTLPGAEVPDTLDYWECPLCEAIIDKGAE